MRKDPVKLELFSKSERENDNLCDAVMVKASKMAIFCNGGRQCSIMGMALRHLDMLLILCNSKFLPQKHVLQELEDK
jgi:hypothetical protein